MYGKVTPNKPAILFLGLLVCLLLTGCGSGKNVSGTQQLQADEIVDYARRYIGVPYRYGGSSPKGFDCSGYVQFVFKHFGCKIPRSTGDQSKTGVPVKKNDLRRGDMVFFRGSNARSATPGHVGIITKVNKKAGQFSFIHASTSKGIRIDDSELSYYKSRFLYARRLIY